MKFYLKLWFNRIQGDFFFPDFIKSLTIVMSIGHIENLIRKKMSKHYYRPMFLFKQPCRQRVDLFYISAN